MECVVSSQPNLFLETVELLYAYINNDPPETLTADGPYCLSVEAVENIIHTACGDVSRSDPDMLYYFQRCILSQEPRRDTCIARNLAYDLPYLALGSIQDECARIRKLWKESVLSHNSLVSVGEYCLHFIPETECPVVPIVDGIDNLVADPTYVEKLREQLQDFEQAITRLEALVTPVAVKLKPLLEPWAKQAEPLAQDWREELTTPETADRLLKMIRFEQVEQVRKQIVQLRYLNPKVGPGTFYLNRGEVFAHVGVAFPRERKQTTIEHWELEAFRLLGSSSRLKMLRSCWQPLRPKRPV